MAHIGLSKLVKQVEIKSHGDVFHEIFRFKLHQLSNITPTKIQNVDLHEGDWGSVGSVLVGNYTQDGKEKVIKQRIEAIDEEKKLVSFKIIEGDLMELYKTCIFTVHVETHGENNLVTWTAEYEKLNEDVEDPTSMLDLCIAVTKDIDTHHLNN
ncbi:kirola-like [Impatiens glandulifera]|uniref:kirola-like n=1 Tax=Impatiens glandulifera TaxID=253017 RepID=UPI001FB0CD74|nr:kirola-like [Impatiens glandulifera]